jgi:hypothetical protein
MTTLDDNNTGLPPDDASSTVPVIFALLLLAVLVYAWRHRNAHIDWTYQV